MADEGALYFISDASSMRGASVDGGRAVYQLGADLQLLDLSTGESTKLDIDLHSDHPGLRESWETEPMKYLHSARLSGDAEKVAITARGAAALAGTGSARLVNVGAPGNARVRQAVGSQDGKWVYAISDTSGEPSLWRYSAVGGTEAEQLTLGSASTLGSFVESPDGRWIAYGDGQGGLWVLDTDTRASNRIIDESATFHLFTDMEWSSNSQLLAVTHIRKGENRPRILLHDISDGRQEYVTSDKYESGAPTFSQDGQWIYYLSNRNFDASGNGVWQDRDFGPSFDKRAGVFAQPLTKGAQFPFATPNELIAAKGDEDENEDENEDEDSSVVVDWGGLSADVWQVPHEFDDYSDLAVNEGYLYVLVDGADGGEIKSLPLEPEATAESFTTGVVGMELSHDGGKLLVATLAGEDVALFIVAAEAKFPEDPSKNTIQTAGWQIRIDPRTEWQQMFSDAWLMHRDQFFDSDMRGVDWVAMREKYLPLAMRVTDRHELSDVLAQMMGELNTLHSAVRGGDLPTDPEAPAPSLLGAVLEQTDDGVVVSRIYRHDEEVPSQAPPLAQPGVDAAAGDLIARINGITVSTLPELHRALRNQAGKQVLIDLSRNGDAVQTVVVPAAADQGPAFSYRDWVNGNRSRVEAAGAELGYVHLRAMGSSDAAEFAREFYASNTKQGFVIDVRRNNGGNIDSWVIERLLRRAWSFWTYKSGEPYTNMQNAFRGHLVVLANERTYSDGETFTAAIKALDIAPVIGQQTAGAGVWLSGRNALSDGGIARVAEMPVFSMDGRWIVEGRGVSPTIEVRNMPHATYMGSDAQLEAAIEYLKNKLEEEPIPELKPGPFPDNGVPGADVDSIAEP
jgi:tricorn protease